MYSQIVLRLFNSLSQLYFTHGDEMACTIEKDIMFLMLKKPTLGSFNHWIGRNYRIRPNFTLIYVFYLPQLEYFMSYLTQNKSRAYYEGLNLEWHQDRKYMSLNLPILEDISHVEYTCFHFQIGM